MANTRKLPRVDASPGLTGTLQVCLERYVSSGQSIAVGLSGGIDSVVLLHVLAMLRRNAPARFKLAAIHVNHGISPNADQWSAFCRHYCKLLAIDFSSVAVQVERTSKDGLEGAARRARHASFSELSVDWVMLAQHRDDQAETLLFNLLRGSGLSGVAAMRERNGRLLRPFLSVSRNDIESYAQEHELEWVEDESNADIRHSRNFLRWKILPELRNRFPAVVKTLANTAARFAEAQLLLDDLARIDLGMTNDFPVDIALLDSLDDARARNALRYLLAQRQVMIPSEARLHEALRQMRDAGADRHPAMVFGAYRLLRRRGRVYLEAMDGRGSKDSC